MMYPAQPDSSQDTASLSAPPRPQPAVSPIRPWIRFWARNIDVILGSILLYALMGLIRPALWESDPPRIVVAIMSLICAFFNAGCLAAWGTTPGKWLLATRVRDKAGRKPRFSRALSREFTAWWKGWAAGIPFLQLISFVVAYTRLKERGVTAWDEETDLVVSHERIPAWRVIVIVAVLAFISILAFVAGMSES